MANDPREPSIVKSIVKRLTWAIHFREAGIDNDICMPTDCLFESLPGLEFWT